jgi:hypothetical protein
MIKLPSVAELTQELIRFDTPYERAMHGADERVPVSSLEFGTAAIHQAIERYRC